tara:strand:- start:287 stop:634 length:348 start_codon:yes stop_codon:yes gene_type:complete
MSIENLKIGDGFVEVEMNQHVDPSTQNDPILSEAISAKTPEEGIAVVDKILDEIKSEKQSIQDYYTKQGFGETWHHKDLKWEPFRSDKERWLMLTIAEVMAYELQAALETGKVVP